MAIIFVNTANAMVNLGAGNEGDTIVIGPNASGLISINTPTFVVPAVNVNIEIQDSNSNNVDVKVNNGSATSSVKVNDVTVAADVSAPQLTLEIDGDTAVDSSRPHNFTFGDNSEIEAFSYSVGSTLDNEDTNINIGNNVTINSVFEVYLDSGSGNNGSDISAVIGDNFFIGNEPKTITTAQNDTGLEGDLILVGSTVQLQTGTNFDVKTVWASAVTDSAAVGENFIQIGADSNHSEIQVVDGENFVIDIGPGHTPNETDRPTTRTPGTQEFQQESDTGSTHVLNYDWSTVPQTTASNVPQDRLDLAGGSTWGKDTLNLINLSAADKQAIINAANASSTDDFSYDPTTSTLVGTPGTGNWFEFTASNGQLVRLSGWADIVICFARGTMIRVEQGEKPIEDLAIGDLVWTLDDGYQPIRWIGSRKLDKGELDAKEKLRPVRIAKGALGADMPKDELRVSPQHRMLVRSKIAQRMFGREEVLIPANKLLALDGISIDRTCEDVEYFHMLFDRHQIVASNAALTESLLTGPVALKSVSPEAREEILELFPQLADPSFRSQPVRPVPEKGKLMTKLVSRHAKNRTSLVREQCALA